MSESIHPIGGIMDGTLEKIKEMVGTNTVIGEPIATPDGVYLIPVSKVTFGFMSGGSEFVSKHAKEAVTKPFGGGAGAGVNIIPVAFIVVKGESVRVLNIEPSESNTFEKIVDAVPDIIDKISDIVAEAKKKKEAKKAAEAEANAEAEAAQV